MTEQKNLAVPFATSVSAWAGARLSILLLLGAGFAGFASAQSLTEFPVTTANSFPVGITTGSDGALWFAEFGGNKIARITSDGAITNEFSIPTAGGQPNRVAKGSDGAIWFTEFAGNRIGRITTAGAITEFAVPTGNSGLVGIAAGPDGALWFTEYSGNKIGRITTAGVITNEYVLPTSSAGPIDIVAGPDGALWFTEQLSNKIGRITTAGAITESAVPTPGSGLVSIASAPDGALWFTEFNANKIGRISAAGVVTNEFTIPVADSKPSGITTGPDAALWFTAFNGNSIGRITTGGLITNQFFVPTPSSSPTGITAGPDGGIWFTEESTNNVGRLRLAGGICAPDATTLCLNGGRFKVQTQWRTPDGRSGAGQAIALTGDTGYFWFFTSNNVEMIVKLLNGCGFNSKFWTFAGGLTNVNVIITVTDTQTGAIKNYTNPQGTAFQPIQDTVFAGCASVPDTSAAVPIEEVGSRSSDALWSFPAPPDPSAVKTTISESYDPAAVAAPCLSDAVTLCLNNGRFKVTTQWFLRDGRNGAGAAVSLTGDTGYFWFFSANNVEMVAKVLNACTFNSRYWTFAGGLTDVNVNMTVTDSQTGAVKTYTNPQGSPFQPIQDTNAFVCP